MYTGCHCPVTAGQKGGGGVWEMDIRDPPWAQANFLPPQLLYTAARHWAVGSPHLYTVSLLRAEGKGDPSVH